MTRTNATRVVESLKDRLERSPYFGYVVRHLRRIAIEIRGETLVLEMDGISGAISASLSESGEDRTPVEARIELSEGAFLEGEAGLPARIVRHGGERELPQPIQELLLRSFDSRRLGSPAADREELVYAALFDFKTPEELWRSAEGVRVLLYRGGLEGLDVCVTSGLTSPERGRSAVAMQDRQPMGFGYELVLLSPPGERMLWREVIGWASYVCQSGSHILRGNWLEYAEGRIPETDLAGFLVVGPATFPESFPMGGGWAQWNLLLGATAAELEQAKRMGVLGVAQRLFEGGFRDWTTARRSATAM